MAVINCQIVFCFVLLLSTPGLGTTELSQTICKNHIPTGTHCHQQYCTDEICKKRYSSPQTYGVCNALGNTCTCFHHCQT